MPLITELIEGYADMTAEEKLSALEKLEQPGDTETRKWKTQYDKTAHDLAEQKKAYKALQEQLNSKLGADELAEKQRQEQLDAIIAERDALKRESAISKTTAQYIGLGYSQELAESTANALYDNDIDTVLKNASAFKTDLEQKIKAESVRHNPVPKGKGSGASGGITKEEFSKMGYQQRLDLYNKDKAKYDELVKNE